MITQRITGAWIAFFTGCVVLNHAILGQLSIFDAIYGVVCVPLVASVFVDRQWARMAQVVAILSTGALMVVVSDYSRPFGFLIMAGGQLYVYRYGFLSRHLLFKVIAMAVAYLVLFLATSSNPGNAILWFFMAITCQGGVWLPVWDLIKENRKELEKTIATKEALLEETVEAGMILVNEIKNKEANCDCKE